MSKGRPAAELKAEPKRKYATWEHPEGSGIKIAEIPNKSGGVIYGVSYQIRVPARLTAGKRELLQKKTRIEAERLAEDRFIALKQHGTEFAKIPAAVQQQAAHAWSLLNEANHRAGLEVGLIDAVRAGIRTLIPAGGRRTVEEVVTELTASKESRQKSGRLDAATLHDFKVRGTKIGSAFSGRNISEILHTDIIAWLNKLRQGGGQFGRDMSPRSVKNYRNTLSEVFSYAKAKQYCAGNPFERLTREDLKTLGGENNSDVTDISILTVEQARKLLRAALESKEPGVLASLVLRLFCGLRTTEVCRLDWQEVHWLDERPFVHIPPGKAKKRRIRLVDIPANALIWLRKADPPALGRIVSGTGDARNDTKAYCARLGRLVRAAKLEELENNAPRHSFGSYHYALHGDALRTAKEMGHSQGDAVLFAHYRALVTKEAAEKYFSLIPERRSRKIERFPAAVARGA